MKKLFYMIGGVLSLFISQNALAQTSRNVRFTYDVSGNRLSRRELAVGTSCRKSTPQKDVLKGSSITLYPNPAQSVVNIKMESQKDTTTGEFFLYDFSGRMIQSSRIVLSTLTSVNLSGYTAGTYILKLRKGEEETTWKVVKVD